MLHTQGLGHLVQLLELDDGGVLAHFLYLFAILDVDVGGSIFLVMLYGEAISRRRAFAAQSVHLRANDIYAQFAQVAVLFDYSAV